MRLKQITLIFLKNAQNQKNQSKKKKKSFFVKNAIITLNGRERGLNACESRIFPKKNKEKDLQVF